MSSDTMTEVDGQEEKKVHVDHVSNLFSAECSQSR